MGTRCNIIFNEKIGKSTKKIYLYHHYDGYPSGVGADIRRYLDEMGFFSGDSMNWMGAITLSNEIVKGKIFSKMYGRYDEEYKVTNGVHGDINYLYVIDCDRRTVKCYDACFDWKRPSDITRESHLVEIPSED